MYNSWKQVRTVNSSELISGRRDDAMPQLVPTRAEESHYKASDQKRIANRMFIHTYINNDGTLMQGSRFRFVNSILHHSRGHYARRQGRRQRYVRITNIDSGFCWMDGWESLSEAPRKSILNDEHLHIH